MDFWAFRHEYAYACLEHVYIYMPRNTVLKQEQNNNQTKPSMLLYKTEQPKLTTKISKIKKTNKKKKTKTKIKTKTKSIPKHALELTTNKSNS